MKIVIEDKEFQSKLQQFLNRAMDGKGRAIRNVASEVLRISQFEVPHNVGTLQNSGFVQDGTDEALVGYNTEYAARLHENPQYRFQKGRKGKYLEDPIKNNMHAFLEYFRTMI